MEPNVNPLVPDSAEPSGSPSSSNTDASSQQKFGSSTFQSRSITPLEPSEEPGPPTPAPMPPTVAPITAPTPTPAAPVQPPAAPAAVPPPPPVPSQPPVASGAFVGADLASQPNDKVFTPAMPGTNNTKKRRFRLKSKPALAGLVVLVIGIGFAAYYFGYKTNPSVVYSQSLKNTAKGYDKLIEYVDKESKANYKSSTGTGTFEIKSGGNSTDGKIALKSDDKNGELTFDIGLEGTRINFDGRLIDSETGSQDIYLKATGVKGLGSLVGSPELDAALQTLDGQWIVIDHTLVDSLSEQGTDSTANQMLPPSSSQILSAAQGFGKVNQDYLFSTDEDKAVMQVTEKHGVETVDGHKAYHYTVALQKENVKKYIEAQRSALKASTMNKWLKQNGSAETFDSIFDGLKESANSIKTTDTFDMWADIDTRLIYKIRFAEKSSASKVNSFIDVGLDYKGGDDFPFFIAGQTKDSGSTVDAKAVMNLNTKTQATDFSMDIKTTGYADISFKMKASFKPSNETIKVEKPANAKTLAEVASQLGYGDLISQLQQQ